MTQRSNDDIANALRGLSGGEHREPEPDADLGASAGTIAGAGAGGSAAGSPHPAAPFQAAGPPVAPPAIAKPAAPKSAAPNVAAPKPAAARPVAPKQGAAGIPPRPPVQAKAATPAKPPPVARPARPLEPGVAPAPPRPATPVGPPPVGGAASRGARPTAPQGPQQAETAPAPATQAVPWGVAPAAPSAVPPAAAAADFVQAEPAAAGYDDDAAIMPAPSADYLGHAPHAAKPFGRTTAGGGSVALRKTLIPVLFTSGVLLLVTAAMKYFVDPDAPLAAVPTWLAVVLAVGGLALVGVAVMNSLLVRRAEGAAVAGAGDAPGG